MWGHRPLSWGCLMILSIAPFTMGSPGVTMDSQTSPSSSMADVPSRAAASRRLAPTETLPASVQPPSPGDEEVSDGATLAARLSSMGASISMHLTGAIQLVSPIKVELGRAVTLWSSEDAVVDAQSLTRVVEVWGGQLYLEGLTLTGGSSDEVFGGGCVMATGPGPAWLLMRRCTIMHCRTTGLSGGGVLVRSGRVVLEESIVQNTLVDNRGDFCSGGGMGVEGGVAVIRASTFLNTTVNSPEASVAYGGGLSIWGGKVDADNVHFSGTTASSVRNDAFGGAIASWGGLMQLRHMHILDAEARSDSGYALGGGIGMRAGGVTVESSLFERGRAISATSESFGGLVGVAGGADLTLINVTLAEGTASPGGLLAATWDLSSLRVFMPTLRQSDCHGNSSELPPLISSSVTPIGQGGIATIALALPTLEAPLCPVFGDAVSLLGCGSGACGNDADCTTQLLVQQRTTICECADGLYPSPRAPILEVAPYTDGCIAPLLADNLTSITNLGSISLRKTQTLVPYAVANVTLRVRGTAWVLPDARDFYTWAADDPSPSSWLSVVTVSGNLSAPDIAGGDSLAEVMINASAAGLRDAPGRPLVTTVSLTVQLPDPALLDPGASTDAGDNRTVGQSARIPIHLYVDAEPVAWQTTLDRPDTLLVGALGQIPAFTFTARDVEGLPIDHGGANFVATLGYCGENRSADSYERFSAQACPHPSMQEGVEHLQYIGKGRFEVRPSTQRLGLFIVFVHLDGVPTGLHQMVLGVCPAGLFALDGNCKPCPEYASCDDTSGMWQGTSLANLDLQPNRWRASERTLDVRRCNRNVEWMRGSPTSCVGGTGPDYCVNGTTGPFCQACVAENHFFDWQLDVRRCAPCQLYGAAAILTTGVSVFAVIVACSGLSELWYFLLRQDTSTGSPWPLRRVHQASTLSRSIGLVPKLKVYLGYLQVVLAMPDIYEVRFNNVYQNAMAPLRVLQIAVNDFFVKTGCWGKYNVQMRWIANGPIVILILLLAFRVGWQMVQLRRRLGVPLSAAQMREAAVYGARKALPLTLAVLFFTFPRVSSDIFSAFNCYQFGYDDAQGEVISFLLSDLSIMCYDASGRVTEAYAHLRAVAIAYTVIWSIGIPVLFFLLLRRSQQQTSGAAALFQSTRFLHIEYRGELFYWELLEIARKLALTGIVLLIPSRLSLLRLVFAILISTAYLVILQAAAPFRHESTALLSVASAVTIICQLLGGLLLRTFTAMNEAEAIRFFGFADPQPLSSILLAFNALAIGGTILILAVRLRAEGKALAARRLLHVESDEEVKPPPLHEKQNTHLFLSHCWGQAQDQARIIKQRLQELVFGLAVFLDVDDLLSIANLEMHIDETAVVLVFCTDGYAQSQNCMRELRHAVHRGKPLIALLEPDTKRGGLTKLQMSEQLEAAEPRLRDWGMSDEGPSAEELAKALFAHSPIEWNRIGAFQDVTMKLIVERLLMAAGIDSPAVYMQGDRHGTAPRSQLVQPTLYELDADSERSNASVNSRRRIVPAGGGRAGSLRLLSVRGSSQQGGLESSRFVSTRFLASQKLLDRQGSTSERAQAFIRGYHLYCSAHNPGVEEVLKEVVAARPQLSTLCWTASTDKLGLCEAMILYLNALTWSPAARGGGAAARLAVEQLAADVVQAMNMGVPLILLHEMPGLGQEERHAIEFASFLEADGTPPRLVDAGLYKELAITLKGGAWRETSMTMLARAIEDKVGESPALKNSTSTQPSGSTAWQVMRRAVKVTNRFRRYGQHQDLEAQREMESVQLARMPVSRQASAGGSQLSSNYM